MTAVIAFRGATLIDGTGAPPIVDSLIVVADGRIVSVGPATPEAVNALPAGARVVSAEGKWILEIRETGAWRRWTNRAVVVT